MAWVLLAHLVIPLIIGIAFLFLAYITGPENALASELVVEAALDLSILSIGATAAILENPRLQTLFQSGGNAVVAGMTIAAINFFLSVIVIALRRSVYRKGASTARKRTCAFFALICGSLTVICICLPVVYAFRQPELSR